MVDHPRVDAGAYCRAVEEHLTRVNAGHLIRIVGPAFELVRRWADDGIPLSVVFHGVDLKAERHLHGHARRPLRIEFCEADVREVYDTWRRAIGVAPSGSEPAPGGAEAVEPEGPAGPAGRAARRPSLARRLDRVVDRLVAIVGQLDLAESFRDRVNGVLTDVVAVRDRARAARGAGREAVAVALVPLERDLLAAAREAAGADLLNALTREAGVELAPYRDRLGADAWQRAIDTTVDRLLRERFRLPMMTE